MIWILHVKLENSLHTGDNNEYKKPSLLLRRLNLIYHQITMVIKLKGMFFGELFQLNVFSLNGTSVAF